MGILKNPRHEHFAQLVANGVTNTEAAKTAGFSEKRAMVTGSELATRPEVIGRIAELRVMVVERVTEKTAIDKAWVLNELIEVVKMGKAAEPIIGKDGESTGEVKQNLAAANKALELIGKEFGMFIDRSEVKTGPLDGVAHDDLKQINDAIRSLLNPVGSFAQSPVGTRH
jgi:hypothetical protein